MKSSLEPVFSAHSRQVLSRGSAQRCVRDRPANRPARYSCPLSEGASSGFRGLTSALATLSPGLWLLSLGLSPQYLLAPGCRDSRPQPPAPSPAEQRTPPLQTPPGLEKASAHAPYLGQVFAAGSRAPVTPAGGLWRCQPVCASVSACPRLGGPTRSSSATLPERLLGTRASPAAAARLLCKLAADVRPRGSRAWRPEDRGAARAFGTRCRRPAGAAGPGGAFVLGPRPREPHAAPAPAAAAAPPPGWPGPIPDPRGAPQRLSAQAPAAGCPASPESARRARAGAGSRPGRAPPGAQGAPCRSRSRAPAPASPPGWQARLRRPRSGGVPRGRPPAARVGGRGMEERRARSRAPGSPKLPSRRRCAPPLPPRLPA